MGFWFACAPKTAARSSRVAAPRVAKSFRPEPEPPVPPRESGGGGWLAEGAERFGWIRSPDPNRSGATKREPVTTEISPPETGAFPKAVRLRLRADFKRVYAGESKHYGRFIVVFALPNEKEGFRLGITATRKLGNAVKRNLVRRRFREIYRRLRARDLAGSSRGLDLVLNVRPSAVAATFEELRSDVEKVWLRLLERSR